MTRNFSEVVFARGAARIENERRRQDERRADLAQRLIERDHLLVENRSLRAIIHDQERRLASLEKQHRDAMKLLEVADMEA